jgi:hypothetical protein
MMPSRQWPGHGVHRWRCGRGGKMGGGGGDLLQCRVARGQRYSNRFKIF